MEQIQKALYGSIYTVDYEHFSDGGPKCYEDMSNSFRFSIALFSILTNLLIIYSTFPTIRRSKELIFHQNAQPNKIEILTGIASYITYSVQFVYKFYTGRGIFMTNPCHIVLLMQGYLLLTKKSKFSSILFICYMRWLYGAFIALKFPVLTGLDLPFEIEMFWIEHYLGAIIGPLVLGFSGRYLHFEPQTFLQHQFFGFLSHILYQRMWLLPLSLLTFANLNFTLCRPDTDPFLPYVGDWYYLVSEIYLNLMSSMTFSALLIVVYAFRLITKKRKQN